MAKCFFYFRDDESYAERVDALLTVFKSFKNDRIVGVQIKDIAKILSTGEVRKCDYFWADGDTILAVLIELARKRAKTTIEVYGPVIEQAGSTPFRLPQELRERLSATR